MNGPLSTLPSDRWRFRALVLVALVPPLAGCGGSPPAARPIARPRRRPATVEAVADAHRERIAVAVRRLEELQDRCRRGRVEARLRQLHDARDALIGAYAGLAADLERHVADGPARTVRLVMLDEKILLLGRGLHAGDGRPPLSSWNPADADRPNARAPDGLGLCELRRDLRPFPLVSGAIRGMCGGAKDVSAGLGCAIYAGWIPALFLGPIDIGGWLIGSWWWAGKDELRWHGLPASRLDLRRFRDRLRTHLRRIGEADLVRLGGLDALHRHRACFGGRAPAAPASHPASAPASNPSAPARAR